MEADASVYVKQGAWPPSLFGHELSRISAVWHAQVALDDGYRETQLRSNLVNAGASLPEQPGLGGERKLRFIRYAQNASGRLYVRIRWQVLRG
jgi:hypothetical protein